MISDKKIFKIFILKIYLSLFELDMQWAITIEQFLKRAI